MVPGRAPVSSQPLHDQPQRQPLAWIVQGGRGCLGVSHGTSRFTGSEGRLGGTNLEFGQLRRGLRRPDDLVQREGSLVVSKRVRTRFVRLGDRRSRERSLDGLLQLIRRQVVDQCGAWLRRWPVGESRPQRGVVPAPRSG